MEIVICGLDKLQMFMDNSSQRITSLMIRYWIWYYGPSKKIEQKRNSNVLTLFQLDKKPKMSLLAYPREEQQKSVDNQNDSDLESTPPPYWKHE